jgi:hypothetical protein
VLIHISEKKYKIINFNTTTLPTQSEGSDVYEVRHLHHCTFSPKNELLNVYNFSNKYQVTSN